MSFACLGAEWQKHTETYGSLRPLVKPHDTVTARILIRMFAPRLISTLGFDPGRRAYTLYNMVTAQKVARSI